MTNISKQNEKFPVLATNRKVIMTWFPLFRVILVQLEKPAWSM